MWTLVDLAFPELLENLLVHAEIVYIWYVAKLESQETSYNSQLYWYCEKNPHKTRRPCLHLPETQFRKR